MSLTSMDPPEVIRFIKTHYPDVELIKPKESVYTVAVRKKLLPTRLIRWCCDVFKEGFGAGKVKIIGIRRQESIKRSMRNEIEISSRKFSGSQMDFDKWRVDQTNQLYDSDILSEDVVKCIGGKDSIIISPIISWSERDVWEFLNNVVKVEHCALYDKGHRRIGCIFCPMANIKEIRRCEKEYPHQRKRWIDTIKIMLNNGCFNNIDQYINMSQFSQDEKAEIIFDWWISKINLKDYVVNRFKQLSINFDI